MIVGCWDDGIPVGGVSSSSSSRAEQGGAGEWKAGEVTDCETQGKQPSEGAMGCAFSRFESEPGRHGPARTVQARIRQARQAPARYGGRRYRMARKGRRLRSFPVVAQE